MTEKEFLRKVIEKDMPDVERVRQNCLHQSTKKKRGAGTAWRYRLAMTIVCVIAAISVGTGVCYAATGDSPIKLFSALFGDSDSSAVAQVSESFVEPNAVLEFDNKEFILEKYFFDQEQGIIFAEMTLRTTDGSPVISWDDAYFEAAFSGWPVEADTAEEWEKLCQKDEEQYQRYKDVCEEAIEIDYLNLYWPLKDFEGNTSVEMEEPGIYHINAICTEEEPGGGQNEESNEKDPDISVIYEDQEVLDAQKDSVLLVRYCFETVGKIPMGNTGTMNQRSVDASKIANCTEVNLTGAFMQIYYDGKGIEKPAEYKNLPFDKIEITMKDGYVYQWDKATWTFYDDVVPGTERILTEEEEQMLEDEPGITKIRNGGTRSNRDSICIFSFDFPDFLNVEDIVSVNVDGVECLMK